MTHDSNSDLRRAMERLTVQDVWRKAGLPNCPREGNHLVKSPFREDKSPSFSICFKGRGFRDHASGERGGVWKFAQMALAKDGKELAEELIDLSGIVRTPKRPAPRDGAPAEPFVPSRRKKPKPYIHGPAKLVMESERAKALESRVTVRNVPEWSEGVRQRWRQGSAYSWKKITDLAESRSWPERWVLAVHELDLLAYPLLPWCDTRRGRPDELSVAFKVEAPLFTPEGEFKGQREIGYHQRFEIRGEKSWVYVPYLVQADRCRSEFQAELRREAFERGAQDGGDALVPGLPFVLSGGSTFTHLFITVGQWDAITVAGALGWLDGDAAWPQGWWVMGVRGANGADTLLAYWQPLLRRWKPKVLVLADNDKAGLWWDNAHMAGQDHPWAGAWEMGVQPSFADKLRAVGCREVLVRRVARQIGKDFNDYWRAKRPPAADMLAWLGKLGFAV